MGERIIFSSLIITFYSHDDILLFIFKSTQSLSAAVIICCDGTRKKFIQYTLISIDIVRIFREMGLIAKSLVTTTTTTRNWS
jgi:hypothetical protein